MAFSGKALLQGVKEHLATAEAVNLARIAAPLGKDEKASIFWHGSALQQRMSGLGKAFNDAGLEGDKGKYAGIAAMGATVAGGEFINEKIAEKQGGVMGGITRGMGIGLALMDTINLRQYSRFAAPLARKILTKKGVDEAGAQKFADHMVQKMGTSPESLSNFHDHVHGSMIRPLFSALKAKSQKLSSEESEKLVQSTMNMYSPRPEFLYQTNDVRDLMGLPGIKSASAHPGTSTGQAGAHTLIGP